MGVFARAGFIYLAFILGFCQIIGCKTDDSENFQMPTAKEYNQIIAAIINQDKTFIKQNEGISLSKALQIIVVGLHNSQPDSFIPPSIEEGFPFASFSILVECGLISKIDRRDSLYLNFQVENMKSISMDETIHLGIQSLAKEPDLLSVLIFSVPVFNSEKDKVFVQAKLGNDAVLDYLLYRVNNKWILINTGVKRGRAMRVNINSRKC